MIGSFLFLSPIWILLKVWKNYWFFRNHIWYKNFPSHVIMFFAIQHVIDVKYGKLWHLHLKRDYVEINDFIQWPLQDYIKKFEPNCKDQSQLECPICLIKFKNKTMVIGLQCSTLHIYHRHCLAKMLSSGEDNCAICGITM